MEEHMNDLAEILEHELEEALEVKDKHSLHRYVRLLVGSMVDKDKLDTRLATLQSDVKIIADRMDRGFRRMDERFEDLVHQIDKRFEQVDKRFEQVDKRFEDFQHRFTMMFAFITIGFTILSTMMVLFQLFN
jgi:chaperonin cofactor prefoldin